MADKNKSQADKFREAAKEAETDDDEDRLDAIVKRIAKAPPSPSDKKSPK